jgi:GH25 family lysozyme M1 (1,4-beta-N-acetylmuramidase)
VRRPLRALAIAVALATTVVTTVVGLAGSSSAAIPAGYTVAGIDVSKWQGTVDWTNVSQSARFAYVKATEGTTYLSPTFNDQYFGARAAGLYVGAYAFARPDAAPVPQADYYLSQASYASDGRTLPPMLDVEWPYMNNGVYVAPSPCWGLTPAAMVAWIRAYVNEIRARTGQPTMIYTAYNWWNQCTANSAAFSDTRLFLASFTTSPPTLIPASWTKWTMWQYSSSGSLPGDQDVFNGPLSDLSSMVYPCVPKPRTQTFAGDANIGCKLRPAAP